MAEAVGQNSLPSWLDILFWILVWTAEVPKSFCFQTVLWMLKRLGENNVQYILDTIGESSVCFCLPKSQYLTRFTPLPVTFIIAWYRNSVLEV